MFKVKIENQSELGIKCCFNFYTSSEKIEMDFLDVVIDFCRKNNMAVFEGYTHFDVSPNAPKVEVEEVEEVH